MIYKKSWLMNLNSFYGVLIGFQLGGQGNLQLSRSSCYVTFILIAKFITTIKFNSLLVIWMTLVVIGPIVRFTASKEI